MVIKKGESVTQHVCMHEKDITLLVDRVHDIGRDQKSLITWLKGNGTPGLITKVALIEQSQEKLYDRVDGVIDHLERMGERTDKCISNDEAIKRLTKIVWWILSPTLATIIVGVIKMAFFGG